MLKRRAYELRSRIAEADRLRAELEAAVANLRHDIAEREAELLNAEAAARPPPQLQRQA